MSHVKMLELRDKGTFIPLLCVDMNPDINDDGDLIKNQYWLLRRCGHACDKQPNIILTRLSGDGKASNDPYAWGDRTFSIAHKYIIEAWHGLADGDVIDVEFIFGETLVKKTSERYDV
jgi:hypothetical protein